MLLQRCCPGCPAVAPRPPCSGSTSTTRLVRPAGVNLLEVMCHPDVDYTRTVSNEITEMLQTLGIEAARNALLKELRGGCRGSRAWQGSARGSPVRGPSAGAYLPMWRCSPAGHEPSQTRPLPSHLPHPPPPPALPLTLNTQA